MSCRTYIHNVLVAIDQLFNAVCCGWPDESLSSRAWRWHIGDVRHWPYRAIEALFFWQNDHCRESYESERLRRQFPPELRQS